MPEVFLLAQPLVAVRATPGASSIWLAHEFVQTLCWFVSGVEFTSTVAGIALKRRTMLCLRRTGNLILVSLILRH